MKREYESAEIEELHRVALVLDIQLECWDRDRNAFKLKPGGARSRWNPRDNDGDAFRAVVRARELDLWKDAKRLHPQVDKFWDGDAAAATRQAVVRALASLSKTKAPSVPICVGRPQECAASGAGHSDGPHGINGETQCAYCGQPPDTPPPCELRPMSTAPTDGSEVLLKVKARAGIRGKFLVGHYQPGGHCIEDHPPIAQGWYFWNGCMFDKAAEPVGWIPLPVDGDQHD